MLDRTAVFDLLRSIHSRLLERGDRLVLVESCTAGLVASWFGQLPGISDSWCGSLVVYRNASKTDWLGLDADMLDDPSMGPVSSLASLRLADAALEHTPESTVAAAITGHLGPNAPSDLDGHAFCCYARRDESVERSVSLSMVLRQPSPSNSHDIEGRRNRQEEAAFRMLEGLSQFLLDRN
jgi:nicotinamide-nucleotide amidase